MKSCTAPANTTPPRIHSIPGVAHLRGEHRADERPGAGDRGEVMAEQHVFVGRYVVEAVVVFDGRRHPQPVELHHLAGDETAVEAICDQIDTDCCDHDPQRADAFAVRKCDRAEREGAEQRDRGP
jgi:hypothetical protein